MRAKVLFFRLESEIGQALVNLFLQLPQNPGLARQSNPEDPRMAHIRKNPGTVETQFEWTELRCRFKTSLLNFSTKLFVNLAQKFEGQMDIVGIDPGNICPGASQVFLQRSERGYDIGRNFDRNERSHTFYVITINH